MKILVVDDEKLLVKGIKFNLENEGYDVDVCYDGATAVQMAAQGGYDLIILDLMMPGLDGLEACQRIRQTSTVPIIMLTAKSEDADKRTAYKHGRSIDLTAREFDLAELFLRSPGRVFSRDSLLDLVWGYDYQGDARTVDVHIRRLREKLEDNPASPSLIITKWGVGYYLAE